MNIRLFKPSVGQDELDALKEVFDRQWLGLGPTVSKFERAWTDYIGSNSSVAVNSATAALHLALTAFGFPKGKKVLVPAITFVSTASAVIYNGLEPVFVDVDEETVSISIEDLERKYTKDCVAVIPVHNGGYPANMEKIMEFARLKNLRVIEDCAHCAGGEYKGKKLGTWGDIGCFSFEEKKCMTTGDGGMISSDDVDLIEPLKAHRWIGIDKDTWRRNQNDKEDKTDDPMHWHYEISVLGYKYNMNDIAAAIGMAQLKKLDKMNEKRRDIISKYLTGIQNNSIIKPIFPYKLEGNEAYWFFGIRTQRRDDLIIYLSKNGIANGVHFYPIPLHPYYQKYDNGCLTAKKIWKEFITLPSHVELTDEEVDYVVEHLNKFEKERL